jgi:hypothetical protein
VSSTVLGLLFAMLGFALDRDLVRLVAAVLLVVLGVVLLSLRAQGSFARLLAPVTDGAARLLARTPRSGVVGQFLVGRSSERSGVPARARRSRRPSRSRPSAPACRAPRWSSPRSGAAPIRSHGLRAL